MAPECCSLPHMPRHVRHSFGSWCSASCTDLGMLQWLWRMLLLLLICLLSWAFPCTARSKSACMVLSAISSALQLLSCSYILPGHQGLRRQRCMLATSGCRGQGSNTCKPLRGPACHGSLPARSPALTMLVVLPGASHAGVCHPMPLGRARPAQLPWCPHS